jgi:predicted nucleic acid-binding protein
MARPHDLRDAMDEQAQDAVVTEDLIDSLRLPDPEDRHVLAAAIVGQADVIVTVACSTLLRRRSSTP